MDLNYIYERHAVSLRNAEQASCAPSRLAHHELAAGYARLIARAKLHGTRTCRP